MSALPSELASHRRDEARGLADQLGVTVTEVRAMGIEAARRRVAARAAFLARAAEAEFLAHALSVRRRGGA